MSINRRMDTQEWKSPTMEDYRAIERDELQVRATACKNLTEVTQTEPGIKGHIRHGVTSVNFYNG